MENESGGHWHEVCIGAMLVDKSASVHLVIEEITLGFPFNPLRGYFSWSMSLIGLEAFPLHLDLLRYFPLRIMEGDLPAYMSKHTFKQQ